MAANRACLCRAHGLTVSHFDTLIFATAEQHSLSTGILRKCARCQRPSPERLVFFDNAPQRSAEAGSQGKLPHPSMHDITIFYSLHIPDILPVCIDMLFTGRYCHRIGLRAEKKISQEIT